MLTTLLLAVLALPSDVIVVASDGSGQFKSIQAAIDAAAPGDVLEIEFGHYGGFVLDKNLALVGPGSGSHPIVNGLSSVSATDFRIAGLDFGHLVVSGEGSLADCRMLGSMIGVAALQVSYSQGVLFSDCIVQGMDQVGGPGCTVAGSVASFSGCTIRGGEGYDVYDGMGGDAGDALLVVSSSHVTLAECDVSGGTAGFGNIFLNPWNGKPGDGLVSLASEVVVRGGTNFAGLGSGYTDDPDGPFGLGLTVIGGKVSVSHAYFDPSEAVITGGGILLQPASPEPLVDLQGGALPGGGVQLRVFGLAGEPGLLVASTGSSFTSVPSLEGPLWAPLGGLVLPIVASGFPAPLDLFTHVPDQPGIEGTAVRVQVVFPGLHSVMTPAKLLVTNPAAFVVHF